MKRRVRTLQMICRDYSLVDHYVAEDGPTATHPFPWPVLAIDKRGRFLWTESRHRSHEAAAAAARRKTAHKLAGYAPPLTCRDWVSGIISVAFLIWAKNEGIF